MLWRTIEDHDTLFVLAEMAHFVGIGLLGFKILTKKSVAGTYKDPARNQQQLGFAEHFDTCRPLTADTDPNCPFPGHQAVLQVSICTCSCLLQAAFLSLWVDPDLRNAVCSFMMEYDIHTVLDGLTLVATGTVLYAMIATSVKNTYQSDLDSVKFYFVVSCRCRSSLHCLLSDCSNCHSHHLPAGD